MLHIIFLLIEIMLNSIVFNRNLVGIVCMCFQKYVNVYANLRKHVSNNQGFAYYPRKLG